MQDHDGGHVVGSRAGCPMRRRDWSIVALGCLVVASCATFRWNVGPYRAARAAPEVLNYIQHGTELYRVSDTKWILLQDGQPLPSCGLIERYDIAGVQPADGYELDLSELGCID